MFTVTNEKDVTFLNYRVKLYVLKMVIQELSELKYETLSHPAHTSDFALTDYLFFKQLYNFLTGEIFRNDENIKKPFEAFIESRSLYFNVNGIHSLYSVSNNV
uniref:Histone-lysine N-methyltransferase SETMAR n=1 Tax=Strongyloides venezuelensis TaxID=75913 RepID=A0A0K0F0N4_STRVS